MTPQCDFCDSHEIAWRYRAESFQLPTTLTIMGASHTFPWGSEGDWAACKDCSNFIEIDDWDGLCDRSLVTNPLFVFLVDNQIVGLREAVLNLHQKFSENRIGPRMAGWAMPERKS